MEAGIPSTTVEKAETRAVISLSPVAAYAEKIAISWHKATEGIFEVAMLCAQANEGLLPAEKKELFSKLPFHRTIFSKLAQIGASPGIHRRDVHDRLPANYSLLYELTKWSQQELNAAITEGIVNPHATRTSLQKWIKARRAIQDHAGVKIAFAESGWHVKMRYQIHIKETDAPRVHALKRLWNEADELRKMWRYSSRDERQQFVMEILLMPND